LLQRFATTDEVAAMWRLWPARFFPLQTARHCVWKAASCARFFEKVVDELAPWALLSALFASVTAVLAKAGVKGIDSNLE
jgi:hypothetical protein